MARCKTKLCKGAVKPTKNSKWISTQYCQYIKAKCGTCAMLYWMIKREQKTHIKDRKIKEKFEHRKKDGLR